MHIGDSLTITCKSYSQVSWTLNDEIISKENIIQRSMTNKLYSLRIQKIEMADAGEYACYGTKKGDIHKYFVRRSIVLIKSELIAACCLQV